MKMLYPLLSAAALVVVKLIQRRVRYGSVFGKERWAPKTDLSGQVCIVTGCNSGIGKETAKTLARWGATVVMACRSLERTKPVIEEVIAAANGDASRVIFSPIDLMSLDSVRKFVADIEQRGLKIDILINNAGVNVLPKDRTSDGFGAMLDKSSLALNKIGVNHLAHYLLTLSLLEKHILKPTARIVVLSSSASGFDSLHFDDLDCKNYSSGFMDQFKAYGSSKLANAMFMRELDRRLKAAGSQIITVAVHPGAVKTELGKNGKAWEKLLPLFTGTFLKSPEYGAQTSLTAAVAPFTGGEYLRNCLPEPIPNKQAYDEEACCKLWDESARLVGELRFAEEGFVADACRKTAW